MTTEEKQLLLQDISARLPYKVCARQHYSAFEDDFVIEGIIGEQIYAAYNLKVSMTYPVEKIKPYLRPMESMTEEDLISYANYDFANDDTYKIVDYRCPPGKGFINLYCSSIRHPEDMPVIFQRTRTSPLENWRGIDWLNEHHFDYRNLIKMGLAIKAPDGMYNF